MSSNYRGPQTVRHVGRGGSPFIAGEVIKFALTVAIEALRFALVLLLMALKLLAWVTREAVLPALQVTARVLQRRAAICAARVQQQRDRGLR